MKVHVAVHLVDEQQGMAAVLGLPASEVITVERTESIIFDPDAVDDQREAIAQLSQQVEEAIDGTVGAVRHRLAKIADFVDVPLDEDDPE